MPWIRNTALKYLVANATLFGFYFLIHILYPGIVVDEEQIYIQYFARGFAWGFVGWMWVSSLGALELY
jgi:hypothetical protein